MCVWRSMPSSRLLTNQEGEANGTCRARGKFKDPTPISALQCCSPQCGQQCLMESSTCSHIYDWNAVAGRGGTSRVSRDWSNGAGLVFGILIVGATRHDRVVLDQDDGKVETRLARWYSKTSRPSHDVRRGIRFNRPDDIITADQHRKLK